MYNIKCKFWLRIKFTKITNYSPAYILMSMGNGLNIDIFSLKYLEKFKLAYNRLYNQFQYIILVILLLL